VIDGAARREEEVLRDDSPTSCERLLLYYRLNHGIVIGDAPRSLCLLLPQMKPEHFLLILSESAQQRC
jgi:hypothetical protein